MRNNRAEQLIMLFLSSSDSSANSQTMLMPGTDNAPAAAPADEPATPPESSRATAGPALVGDPLPQLKLPVERYMESADQAYRSAEARTVTINRCLAQQRADYRVPAPDPQSAPDLMAGRYGPVNNAQANAGYHFMAELLEKQNSQRSPTPPPADRGAAEKCSQKAVKAIPPIEDDGLIDRIKSTDYTKATSLPSVKNSYAKWSRCMAGKGYEYETPLDAMQDRKWNWNSNTATSAEIKVARQDVACKESAGVVAAWFAGESDLQNKDLKKSAKAIRSIAAQIRSNEEAVQKVLSSRSAD